MCACGMAQLLAPSRTVSVKMVGCSWPGWRSNQRLICPTQAWPNCVMSVVSFALRCCAILPPMGPFTDFTFHDLLRSLPILQLTPGGAIVEALKYESLPARCCLSIGECTEIPTLKPGHDYICLGGAMLSQLWESVSPRSPIGGRRSVRA